MALQVKKSGHLIEKLKKVFEKHDLVGSFTESEETKTIVPCDCVFMTESGITLFIITRSAISTRLVEKYAEISRNINSEKQRILLLAEQIPQTLIAQFEGSLLNFYSPEGSSKIEFPRFCYIVALVNKKKSSERNSGTVFTGKATSLPRLFFANPQQQWTQSELSNAADITRGYTSMILKKMLQEEYIALSGSTYTLIAPDKMLNDWTAVYRFSRYIKRQMFAMHYVNYDEAIEKLNRIMNEQKIKFAYMGPSGAYLRRPYMEQPIVTAYVQKMPEDCLELFPVERGGNVILYIPQSECFFIGEQQVKEYPVVSDIQLYLDLKKMPGRNEDQADYLRQNEMNWE